jgi:hypothetical protein
VLAPVPEAVDDPMITIFQDLPQLTTSESFAFTSLNKLSKKMKNIEKTTRVCILDIEIILENESFSMQEKLDRKLSG